MVAITDWFRPAPHLVPIGDEHTVKKTYKYWRWRIFYSMYLGYAFFYLSRNSFVFAAPTLVRDLGMDKSDIGLLASIFSITYGFSKFANGVLADRSNPRYVMAVGLILTGLCNIFFGLSSSLVFFSLFWGLNAWFQGFGWPPCARLLTHWYSQSERGRWWSVWNTSHNIGGAVIPIIAGLIAQYYGWRMALFFPGMFCILSGLFLINRLRDTPQSLGLPRIEQFRDDFPDTTRKEVKSERELSTKEILFEYVLNNPYMWVLAISYFFVYVIRTAVNVWTVVYLVEAKGYSQLGAGSAVFWFEIGGFCGSLLAGWASDMFFRGGRGPINVLFCAGVSLALGALWLTGSSSLLFDSAILFTAGLFIFGPQMLIGVMAADLSHKKAAATATGFVGWIAYVGAAVAGYPIGRIAQVYGWDGFYTALTGCAVLATLLLIPLWGVRTREDGWLRRVPRAQTAESVSTS